MSGILLLAECVDTAPPTAVPTPSSTKTAAPLATPTTSASTSLPFFTPTPVPSSAPTLVGSASARVEAMIPVPGIPDGLAVSRGYVYVLQRYKPFPSPGAVLRIDRANNQVVGAPIRLNFDPWSIAADDDAVWVAKNGPGAVVRIDPQTYQIVVTLDMDASLVAADARGVWLSGAGENSPNPNTASRVDPATNRVVGTPIAVGIEPIQMARGAGSVWVGAHSGPPGITRIDLTTGKVIATIEVGFAVHDLGASSNSVWVADYHDSKVVQISPRTNRIVGEPISLPFPPYAVAVSATDVWVGGAPSFDNPAGPGNDWLVRIDSRTNTIVDTLHLGSGPLAMALDNVGALWVALGAPNRIVKVVPQPLATPLPK